ncbi:unnamed protein product [Penicillium nalgiovense]|uniref:Uncharacterized protein n=1 Tax=Penicillium nalgiovense TaxID=60175 RepID=A0A9W4IQY2_PENNA|nr:unnamed protein product [Penicillium nalgiovense]CAG7969118.1 unnamed protein product [Penicillium nalgiovense]CAG7971711.1 unnamed protein product [Penicillium nalgiovense]CAG7973281.1 unnamed protein product [Penicillium nalgiovense]CAG7996118.1 unnamed protein product [Penicillium nalgiovense]
MTCLKDGNHTVSIVILTLLSTLYFSCTPRSNYAENQFRTMERIYNTLRENRKLPMTDEQLSDLGVDFHQFDIRTGTISSPSVTSYFLPRVDFRDVLDSDLAASPFLEAASCSEVPGPRRHPWILESFEMAMFPDMMTDQYNYFTWTGSDFSFKEFHQEGDTHFFLGGGLLSVRREFLDFECTNTEKLEFPLDELSCHEHKGHQRSIVGFCNQEKCGDKRPSSMELFAIAALTHEEMTEVDRERSYKNRSDESRSDESRSDEDRSDECYFTFPHLVFLMDKFGGCRMFQSYFDGKLHVQFSELLDLGHMIAVPAYGEKYFDMVDRKDFLEKLNLLLKWAWPFPQGNTVAKFPRFCGN